ncbi:MAG: enoyl-CoA hydratase/isomerase family protein [Actinobacteria bacterium]|nr:enoyl-CoA hydratase/isomerase family protein [Actinomycetota bacterium]
MGDVNVTREGNVEIISLNHPEKQNSLKYTMVTSLAGKFEEAQFDDEVRAVILTGEGGSFCSGADLSGEGGREDVGTPVGMRLTTKAYARVVQGIWSLEKPVIAAVEGVAAGGGCNLAFACDMVIASSGARFIQIFVRRGLIADMGGTYFLPRIIGLAKTKELMFSGDEIGAEEAFRIGLVNRVTSPDRLMQEALETATRLANGPTRAIGMIKKMLNSSFESDITTALEREADLQGIAVSTPDLIEGIVAFAEKREPKFKGK